MVWSKLRAVARLHVPVVTLCGHGSTGESSRHHLERLSHRTSYPVTFWAACSLKYASRFPSVRTSGGLYYRV